MLAAFTAIVRIENQRLALAPGSVASSEWDGVGRKHCPLVGILPRAKGISRCRAVDCVASEAAAREAVASYQYFETIQILLPGIEGCSCATYACDRRARQCSRAARQQRHRSRRCDKWSSSAVSS